VHASHTHNRHNTHTTHNTHTQHTPSTHQKFILPHSNIPRHITHLNVQYICTNRHTRPRIRMHLPRNITQPAQMSTILVSRSILISSSLSPPRIFFCTGCADPESRAGAIRSTVWYPFSFSIYGKGPSLTKSGAFSSPCWHQRSRDNIYSMIVAHSARL